MGTPHRAVPGNSYVDVTLRGQAGGGSGQPGLPKLHYVGKCTRWQDAKHLRIGEKSSFGVTGTWLVWSLACCHGLWLSLQNINEEIGEKKQHRRHTWRYCASFWMTTVATTATRPRVTVMRKKAQVAEVSPCTRHWGLHALSNLFLTTVLWSSYPVFLFRLQMQTPLAQRGNIIVQRHTAWGLYHIGSGISTAWSSLTILRVRPHPDLHWKCSQF